MGVVFIAHGAYMFLLLPFSRRLGWERRRRRRRRMYGFGDDALRFFLVAAGEGEEGVVGWVVS